MKKLLLLPVLFLLICTANATIHEVKVSNFQFSPSNLPNVVVGDVVRWVWVSGSHTTTDDPGSQQGNVLPPGAAPWNSSINASTTTFEYTVTVAGTYNYWCIPHAPSMAGSFTATNVLPVKLSAFNVQARNGAALLKWTTLIEQNTSYFSVRRSLNGTSFTEIGRVPAKGNSTSETTYEFTETNPGHQSYYYYNLQVVDNDGHREFSETKMLKIPQRNPKLILSLSPNPVSRAGHLMLTFNADKEGSMNVQVINTHGQAVISTKMQAYKGVNNGHVHLGDLSPGTYIINFRLDGVKEAHTVVLSR